MRTAAGMPGRFVQRIAKGGKVRSKPIVVTGGAGRMGRLVVEMLLSAGYEVLSVDAVRPTSSPCPFVQADLTQAGEVHDVLCGAEAVIHLAAVPGPQMRPSTATFDINVRGTFNIAEAAIAHGLSRIVFASSVFTLGWHMDPSVFWPKYAPVDEAHPVAPLEAYGLSKVVGEEICAAACRRAGLTAVSLRIMNVIQTDKYGAFPWPTPTPEEGLRFVMWPYVDVRDAAESCLQALTAQVRGHEAFYIAARDTRFDAPTRPLLEQLAPQVEIRGALEGRASVINIDKAAAMLGYEPKFEWKSLVT